MGVVEILRKRADGKKISDTVNAIAALRQRAAEAINESGYADVKVVIHDVHAGFEDSMPGEYRQDRYSLGLEVATGLGGVFRLDGLVAVVPTDSEDGSMIGYAAPAEELDDAGVPHELPLEQRILKKVLADFDSDSVARVKVSLQVNDREPEQVYSNDRRSNR